MIVLLIAALLAFAPTTEDLHEAVKANDTARVRSLLDAAADPNFRDHLGAVPLHDAAWNGSREIVELLLDHRADANARHLEAGSTPLHYAIIKDHADIVALLLDTAPTSRPPITPAPLRYIWPRPAAIGRSSLCCWS